MAKFKRIAWLIAYFERNRFFEFEWDEWNQTKIESKHGVLKDQIEEAFCDPFITCLGIQVDHDFVEDRFGIVAKDFEANYLFISFTFRRGKIRPISARVASKKERGWYEF